MWHDHKSNQFLLRTTESVLAELPTIKESSLKIIHEPNIYFEYFVIVNGNSKNKIKTVCCER